jgi:large-conductance mechanosensitive channel
VQSLGVFLSTLYSQVFMEYSLRADSADKGTILRDVSAKRDSGTFGDLRALNGSDTFFNVVTGMVRWIVPLAILWMIGSVSRAFQIGRHPIFDMEIAAGCLCILAVCLRRWISLRAVAAVFVTCLCVLTVAGLASFGMASAGGMMGLAAIGVLCGTVYGRTAGLVAVGFCLAILTASAAGVHFGVLPIFSGSIAQYSQSVTAWISAAANLIIVAVVLILSISVIQERLRLAAESVRAESELTDMALNAQG